MQPLTTTSHTMDASSNSKDVQPGDEHISRVNFKCPHPAGTLDRTHEFNIGCRVRIQQNVQ